MKSAAVTIRLDPQLEELLDEVCRRTGLSRSEVMRDAVAAGVQVLVTGDKDLLAVAEQSPIPILSPRAFLMLTRRGAL